MTSNEFMRTDRGAQMTVTPSDPASRHISVMLDEVLATFSSSLDHPGARYLDGTLGMGGHTEAVLHTFPSAVAVGIDRDQQALAMATQRLAVFGDRFTPVHGVSSELASLVEPGFDAMLFDLGVSSLQLDDLERGFAYRADAPLDMRMDQTQGQTAADIMNTASQDELERILREYGEERYARKIAHAIVKEREKQPWENSGRLVDLLRSVIPAASAKASGHPAKRTFQALRIAVNNELRGWEETLPQALDAVAVGGVMTVLSFHSLEDRLTKQAFAKACRSSAPAGLPVELEHHRPEFELAVRGAQTPSAWELEHNSRSASVKLRAIRRIREKGSQS